MKDKKSTLTGEGVGEDENEILGVEVEFIPANYASPEFANWYRRPTFDVNRVKVRGASEFVSNRHDWETAENDLAQHMLIYILHISSASREEGDLDFWEVKTKEKIAQGGGGC